MESNTTSIISYNTITQQILDGSISLEDITYDQFLEGRKIYNYNEAQEKGYEAHHYIPVSIQIKNYNKLHPNEKISIKNNHGFLKFEGANNTCYRLTPLEHVIAHYLLAKENEECKRIFFYMVAFAKIKLSEDEKEKLEQFKCIAKLREECRLNIRQGTKGKKAYNNGITQIFLSEDETIPEGFVKGILKKEKLYFFNNGEIERQLKSCPKGWQKGRLPKKWDYYTNGIITITAKSCPDGFVKGTVKQLVPNKYGQVQNIKTGKSEKLEWFNDTHNNYLFSVNEQIPQNLTPGKIPTVTSKKKKYTNGTFNILSDTKPLNFKQGWTNELENKISHKGDIWITNGELNKMIKKDSPIPEGYYPGRVFSKKKRYYNNGKEEVFTFKCPEGYQLGKLETEKHWYSNDESIVLANECPEGYKKGRTTNSKIENKFKYAKNQYTNKKELLRWYTDGYKFYLYSHLESVPEELYPCKPPQGNGQRFYITNGKFFISCPVIPEFYKKVNTKEIKYTWYTNGSENIKVKPNENPPKGYLKGKTILSEEQRRERRRLYQYNKAKGHYTPKERFWSNNGIINHFSNTLDEGFVLGRLPLRKKLN